jgi:polysaccharide export outer membrane protein
VKSWFPRTTLAAAASRAKKMLVMTILLGLAVKGGWAQDSRQSTDHAIGTETEKASAVPALNDPKVTVTMSSVSTTGQSYVIGPDDILHIAVWREPDLTATLPVRSDGMISMPLLNDVVAAGLTPMQLAAMLNQRLKKYVAAPRVTVVVTQTNSHRIYVVGEVLHTGAISLLPDMTVLQALATSGLTQFANTKKIYVLRTDNGQEQKIPFNYKQVINGKDTSQNILLKPGDTIIVP